MKETRDWIRDAKSLMKREEAVIVVVKNGRSWTSRRSGIAPLMELIAEDPDFLQGASVLDRVVGRAAAMLMEHGGVARLHALLVSEPAIATLDRGGLEYTFEERAAYIENRDRTGRCPMESACLEIEDPAEAYLALKKKIAEMRSAAATP